jgi:serine/threonine-protein kinase RsbW
VDDQYPADKRSIRARLSVRVQTEAMRELEDFVRDFVAAQGLAAEDEARTLIILEELLTNLSKYGYPRQSTPAGVAEVTLELEGDSLILVFADDGQAFDPLTRAAPDLDQAAASRPVGGLGLQIVRDLADEAHYIRQEGRNVIRLSRRVSISKRPGSKS